MVTVNEAASALGQKAPDLAALQILALNQTITFTQYIRYVLPLDGVVFWLKTQSTNIKGSLHVTTDKQQNEDETLAVNRVIFSTGTQIQLFDTINPNTIWVGAWNSLLFAFTRSDSFYQASGVYHYLGNAVYPAMASQLVDVGSQLDVSTLIVSNSLPIWLSLIIYTPIWLAPLNPGITLYPSFAVPDNLQPPYGVVHIDPNATYSLAAAPLIGPESSHSQLAVDNVRFTLYGIANNQAADFLDLIYRYSLDTDNVGIMGMLAVKDAKRTQAEMNILAMKKTIEGPFSYQQARVNTIAQQMVKAVVTQILPSSIV